MKKCVFVLALFVSTFIARSQDWPDFGIVNSDELAMKECAFDPEAEAIVLIDEAVSNYGERHELITKRHIRIKILKEAGIKYANISLPFYREDDFEYITNIKGLVINGTSILNIEKILLEKKQIFNRNLNKKVGQITFALPSVKVGSIIEYSYESTMKHYGGLRDWEFQKEIPVAKSKYNLYIIPNYEFAYRVYPVEIKNIKVQPNNQLGSISFEMWNIPGFGDEPYMDAREDYVTRAIFQLSGYGGSGIYKTKYMASWDALTREFMGRSDFGGQLNNNLPGTKDQIELTKTLPNEVERMNIIYNYVRQHMSWDGYDRLVSENGIKAAWTKRTGNSADINLSLVSLLRSVNLEANPMFVSERHHGKVLKDYPFVDQFNTVIAAVTINGKNYYLDATNQITPPHIIPSSVLNTTAFILNRKSGGIVNITDESLQYRETINVIASIKDNGTLSGQGLINSIDYARINRLGVYKRDHDEYLKKHIKRNIAGLEIDSFTVLNEKTDSLPLQQKFQFAIPVNSTGDYKFVPLNLFSGFESNPFIAKTRFSDINFGYKRNVSMNVYVEIPEGHEIDALPKSVQLVTPDNNVTFSRELFHDKPSNKILARVRWDFKRSFYDAGEYDDLKDFYKKMTDILNEQLVFKKKANPLP